ncbi:hypothetical protein VPH35_127812 [Triticum aestivum]
MIPRQEVLGLNRAGEVSHSGIDFSYILIDKLASHCNINQLLKLSWWSAWDKAMVLLPARLWCGSCIDSHANVAHLCVMCADAALLHASLEPFILLRVDAALLCVYAV